MLGERTKDELGYNLETEYSILKEKVEGIVITLPTAFGISTTNPLKKTTASNTLLCVIFSIARDLQARYSYPTSTLCL